MAHYKVFLAHRKDAPDPAPIVAAVRSWVLRKVDQDGTIGHTVTVVTGLEDYKAAFAGSGGWSGWTESVARRYAVIVLPDETIGRATHDIVTKAAHLRKAVLAWRDGAVHKCRIVDVNCDDWKNTARVEVLP